MTIHIRKLVNFFDRSAQTNLTGPAAASVAGYQGKKGGLWIGGVVEINDNAFSFQPNALNRHLHVNLHAETVPMDAVISVVRRFGWLTGIVVVTHCRGEFVFRCFGAKTVADRINKFLQQRPKPALHQGNLR